MLSQDAGRRDLSLGRPLLQEWFCVLAGTDYNVKENTCNDRLSGKLPGGFWRQ